MSAFINPFPVPRPDDFDLNHQAFEVPGSKQPGQTAVYVNSAFPHLPRPETSAAFPKTIYESFNLGLKTDPAAPCLGRREWDAALGDWAKSYTWETYAQTDEHRTQIGSALMRLYDEGATGALQRTSWTVGIWAGNRPEWQHVSLATAAYSLTLVSLYDTLGPSAVEYCINHSECRVVFAASDHLPALLTLAGAKCSTMKVIVSLDSWRSIEAKGARPGVKSEGALKAWGAEKGIVVMDITELSALGINFSSPHIPPSPLDVASLCYTSGTTGNPKGGILAHSTLAAAVVSNLHGSPLGAESTYFSYLPLSHIYTGHLLLPAHGPYIILTSLDIVSERFVSDTVLAVGGRVGFTCGDNLRLLEDMSILQPTIFCSVPRVLNRVYQAIKASTIDAPGFKGALTRRAFADKLHNLKEHGQLTHAVWDRLVFKKIRAVLGGNVQYIGSGSAPINPAVLDFLKVAFSCIVAEGYGSTENSGTATKIFPHDQEPNGTVGPPQAGVEIKLVDVPEMSYFSTDKPHPRGELCTRGQMVIPGYYKDAEKSAEAIDQEGWLHTGDIALVDEKGRFKIIDRIKNLVKLSQGEYVALEKVENVYTLSPLLLQIYVHADSLEDHVVAIVVPDPEKFAGLVNRVLGSSILGTDAASLLKASKDPRCIAAVAEELAPYADNARLLGYEKVQKNIALCMVPFTMENDLLTPTFKTKRNIAAKLFAQEIRTLYAQAPKKTVSKL